MKYYLIILSIIYCSCNSGSSIVVEEKLLDPSYSLYNSNFYTKKDSFKNFFTYREKYYIFDLDTITVENRDTIPNKLIYHQFSELKFLDTNNTKSLAETELIFSWTYYETHKFEPQFLSLRYYSDNLLGINIASPIKGHLLATIYDKKTGNKLTSYTKGNFDGSYYIGNRSSYDTFENIRMVVLLDTFLYEKSFNKLEIMDN